MADTPERPIRLTHRLRAEGLAASRFGLVGIAAAATHAGVALALHAAGLAPFPANIVGFLTAFTVSFSGHHFWSFPGDGAAGPRMRRFFVLAFAGFLVNSGALAAWLAWIPLPASIGILVAIAAVPLFTFLGARFWAFRH